MFYFIFQYFIVLYGPSDLISAVRELKTGFIFDNFHIEKIANKLFSNSLNQTLTDVSF